MASEMRNIEYSSAEQPMANTSNTPNFAFNGTWAQAAESFGF
jgi:hypothetical protein